MICWETYVLSWRSKEVVDGPRGTCKQKRVACQQKRVRFMSPKGRRRWAFHNKFQWGWEWALTRWKTSCRRPDAVETQKKVSFMSQKGMCGWAFHNKFQWGWKWALTYWKTSCRRPDAVETQKRVSFMSQKGMRGWRQRITMTREVDKTFLFLTIWRREISAAKSSMSCTNQVSNVKVILHRWATINWERPI